MSLCVDTKLIINWWVYLINSLPSREWWTPRLSPCNGDAGGQTSLFRLDPLGFAPFFPASFAVWTMRMWSERSRSRPLRKSGKSFICEGRCLEKMSVRITLTVHIVLVFFIMVTLTFLFSMSGKLTVFLSFELCKCTSLPNKLSLSSLAWQDQ